MIIEPTFYGSRFSTGRLLAIEDFTFTFADNPVERLNVHLSQLLERFVPTKVIRVRNKDKHWFDDDCRLAFDIKQGANLR